ncbi:hypothetical protein TNCV_2565981 [Trichonephila clavipes]|nr:hypothetical protein TNCV_2565981 [Trichonephila clavipes]
MLDDDLNCTLRQFCEAENVDNERTKSQETDIRRVLSPPLRVALKTGETEEPKIFLPKAFTYGTSCTVFAIQTMKQLVEASRYPLDAEVLLCDTYVDDVVMGSDIFETTQEL